MQPRDDHDDSVYGVLQGLVILEWSIFWIGGNLLSIGLTARSDRIRILSEGWLFPCYLSSLFFLVASLPGLPAFFLACIFRFLVAPILRFFELVRTRQQRTIGMFSDSEFDVR